MNEIERVQRGVALVMAAIRYATRQHWPVVPCFQPTADECACARGAACPSPGKHPRLKGWVEAATTVVAIIEDLWERRPLSNIAIATGAGSDLVALDIDVKANGPASLARLDATHGALPLTPTQRSGGGGVHYFFAYPGGLIPNLTGDQAIAPGVEVKGDGGLIMMAPSLHVSGKFYEWVEGRSPDDVSLAPMPAWLLALILQAKHAKTDRPGRWATRRASGPTTGLWPLILAWLEARGPVRGPDGRGNFGTHCIMPRHVDRRPSLDVHPLKGFICRSCGASGGLRELARRLGIQPGDRLVIPVQGGPQP